MWVTFHDARIDGLFAGTRWRLVAANGRSIAVSSDWFADRAQALAALGTVCREVGRFTVQTTHAGSSVQWAWTAVDTDGVAMAAGDRVFARYGTCVSAYNRFVATARELGGQDLRELIRPTAGR